MVGRDDLQVVHLQAFPQLGVIVLFAQRRRHHILRAVQTVAVIVDRMEKILRTSFGKCGNAAVARLPHLIQRVGAAQVNDVNRRLGHLGDRDRAMNAFGLGDRRTSQCVIFRSGAAVGKKAFDDLVDDDAVLGVHADQTAALRRPPTSRERSSRRRPETLRDTP